MEAKTIRVRIAVAVTADGQYGSCGYTSVSGKQFDDNILAKWAATDCRGEGDKRVVFIEADVPLPVSVTVQGEVAT